MPSGVSLPVPVCSLDLSPLAGSMGEGWLEGQLNKSLKDGSANRRAAHPKPLSVRSYRRLLVGLYPSHGLNPSIVNTVAVLLLLEQHRKIN